MADNLVALLSFVNEAEKYVNKNASGNLGDLSNIDLTKLKKQIAEQISSFDVVENASSIEVGKYAFGDYLKNSVETKKSNVIDELGQIFDVNFDDGIDDEETAKETIDNILGNDQEIEETASDEEPKEVVNDEIETSKQEEDIDEVIETIKEKVESSIELTPKDNDEYVKDTSAEMVEIIDDSIGIHEVIEDNSETETDLIEDLKKNFDDIKDNSIDEENNFGLSEDDEVLNTIRKAAIANEAATNDGASSEQIFQPAPADLDSIFEEVEANKNDDAEQKIDNVAEQDEIENDILNSLSGLINYGQFDETKPNEELEEKEVEAYVPKMQGYILNPLSNEAEEEYIPKEIEELSETPATEEPSNIDDEDTNAYPFHIIENPGLDVMFKDDNVVYSTYGNSSKEENEETIPEDQNQNVYYQVEQTTEENINETASANKESKDENDRYVDNLLSNIEFGGSRVNEILDAREQTYKVIAKMYPYLNYGFIKSAFDLKESIADEYKEGEKIILLHRGSFEDIEDLRKYTEVMMYHNYQVNVDENKMIVDTLKSYENSDGLILNSIFDVANQIALLNGNYEGYCVLTNNEDN